MEERSLNGVLRPMEKKRIVSVTGKITNSRMQTEPLLVVSPQKALKNPVLTTLRSFNENQTVGTTQRNKSLNGLKSKREPAVATIVLFGNDSDKKEAFRQIKSSQKEAFSRSEIPLQERPPVSNAPAKSNPIFSPALIV
jgi:hypothetical protein